MKHVSLPVAVLLAMAFVNGALCADERIVETSPVAVTAPPIVAAEDVTPFGGTLTRIGRQQIDGLAARDFPMAVRRATGVNISRYNLLGSYGGSDGGTVYVRGRGVGRPGGDVRVYVDGVPREVGVWSHPLMDVLPVNQIASISIYKSPQPLLYGGVFGAIDVTSPWLGREGYETHLDASYGEYDTFSLGVIHGGSRDAWDYAVGGAFLETEGHRAHSAGVMRSQYVQTGYDINDTWRAAYILHRSDNWGQDPGREGGPIPQRDIFATRTLTQSLQLRNESDLLAGYVIAYHELGEIRWDKDQLNGPGTPPGDVDTDWQNFGLRSFQDLFLDAWVLTASLDIEQEGGESTSRTLSGAVPVSLDEDYLTISPAVGARLDVALGDLVLTPSVGVRFYDHSEFGSETAPQAGAVLHGHQWRLFSSYSEGIHFPGVYVEGVSAGTRSQLSAEQLNHFEIGVGGECPLTGADVQVSWFSDQASDQLQWTQAGLVNQAESDIDGVELSVRYGGEGTIAAFGGVTYMNPANDRTPRAPQLTVNLGIHATILSCLSCEADLQYVDEQYAFNGRTAGPGLASVEMIDSYVTTNLRFGYDVTIGELELGQAYVAIENVTDESYAYQPGYPMPGRTVSAGLKTSF